MAGADAAIGLLWPSDGKNDREFWRHLPDAVSLLIARYPVGGGLDLEQLRRDSDLDTLLNACRLLRQANPDIICLGDFAAGFLSGPAEERSRIESLEIAAEVPVVSMSAAFAEALAYLGADRIALLSPYSTEATEHLHDYLAEHGITVVRSHSLSHRDENSVDGMAPGDWLASARLADVDDARAVAVAGGGVSLSPIVPQLEAMLNKPVVSGPGALMRAAVRRLRMPHSCAGPGALRRERRGERAAVSAHGVSAFLSRGTKTYSISPDPPVFAAAQGSWLVDTAGKRYLDFGCGSGTTNLGHNHPSIMDAARSQMNTGLTHIGPHFLSCAQARLYQCLGKMLPVPLGRFHPATNGTEATETAIKAAMHFTGRRKFLAFGGSYHGRTLGSLAVSENKGINRRLGKLAPDAVFVPYGCSEDELARALAGAGPLAGILVEPVQATGGMIVPPAGWMGMVARHSASQKVPLIVDEAFTGMGRAGRRFAFMGEEFIPDLLVLGKGFAGGFPAGLVAGRDDIMTAWRPGTQSSTFQLHPVSAAAALASVEFMLRHDTPAMARRIGDWLLSGASRFTSFPFVSEVRGRGAMLGVEVVDESGQPDQPRAASIRAAALANGLVTWECGSQGHVIGIVPPLTITKDDFFRGIDILRHCCAQVGPFDLQE